MRSTARRSASATLMPGTSTIRLIARLPSTSSSIAGTSNSRRGVSGGGVPGLIAVSGRPKPISTAPTAKVAIATGISNPLSRRRNAIMSSQVVPREKPLICVSERSSGTPYRASAALRNDRGLIGAAIGDKSRVMATRGVDDIEWRVSPGLSPYEETIAAMEARAAAIRAGEARELVWLLEHPPLYTAGTSAVADELLAPNRFPVFKSGRGGRYTYHGPGQRVGYVLLDLDRRGRDIRAFVGGIENWLIAALAELGVAARQEPGRIGIWTGTGLDEAKIGAIGVRVRRWVSFHGFSINVDPDLSHFSGIVPCGIGDFAVTSLARLGIEKGLGELDIALARHFPAMIESLRNPDA